MYDFLWTPKWLFGHVLVATVLVVFVAAGFWQLSRLDEAREQNAALASQLDEPPRDVAEAFAGGGQPYTPVTAEGVYDADHQILSTPRSRDGRPGHDVLTPLETDAGPLLVDRGWVPFDRDGVPEETVAPPEGTVRVAGLLMPPQEGPSGDGAFVGAKDPAVVGERVGIDLLPLHLQLEDADPAPSGPAPNPRPEFDEGNHLSYAIQWFLFTAVVAIGYPILIARTAADRRRDARADEAAEPVAAGRAAG